MSERIQDLLADPAYNPLAANFDDVQSSVWDQLGSSVWQALDD